ncbi:MAG: tRNA (guanosine(37)-N1)-methyltransferase TrmD [Magnetococcales bacterium]|nr:tRNA (guanosine(37)-N1)-methyltransferase TrmD [Magnetococcales bacterium]MBF0419961.1 tRNA (guanosine(37)-N1)-methyltransferase TrmD [Magnetococcales bacterium]MBF0436772.1 tRNA (guanosine(37)-N1)-methyltransferase TrmD [Magnetococcales bacterium]
MRFSILTLFPEMFSGVVGHSMLARGVKNGSLAINLIPLRDFALDRHRTVDDTPFGGGPGMVIKPDVLEKALLSIDGWQQAHRVYLSPQGKAFKQQDAMRLAGYPHVVLICGHYEGVDERFVERYVEEEISLGDFVLTGGEIAALAVLDATARLVPGVLGDEESYRNDSFFHGLLDHPHYTRPASWEAQGGMMRVPNVLLSGHHGAVQQWRRRQSWLRTWFRRPDLLQAAPLTKEEKRLIQAMQHDWEQEYGTDS